MTLYTKRKANSTWPSWDIRIFDGNTYVYDHNISQIESVRIYLPPCDFQDCNFGNYTQTSAATCTSANSGYATCSICGGTSTYSTVSALGHNHSDITSNNYKRTNATCTTVATYYDQCSRCGTKMSNYYHSVGNKLEHDLHWQHDSNATCTTNGTQHRYCSRCSYTDSWGNVWQNALGHNWRDDGITIAPTVYNTGTHTYTCINSKHNNVDGKKIITLIEPKLEFSLFKGSTQLQVQKIYLGNNLVYEVYSGINKDFRKIGNADLPSPTLKY